MTSLAATDTDPIRHPLLAAVGCPSTGNGALVYLQQLGRSIEACNALGIGTSTHEWIQIVNALNRAIVDLGNGISASPLPAELTHQPWGLIHGCIDIRAKVRRQSTRHLDALLGLMLVECATGGKALTTEALSGVKTCFSAISGKRKLHTDWELLATPLIVDETTLRELLTGLSHPPVRAFGQLVLGYLARPMPTPAGVEKVPAAPTVSDHEIDETASTSILLNAADATAAPEPTADISAEEFDNEVTTGSRFQRGESVIDWHHKRAYFSSRNNRLGLESWECLSMDQVCMISAKLMPLLKDPSSPMHRAAIVAMVSLLTSTPGHVLLHIRLNTCNDLWIDTNGNRFCWSMEMLRAGGGADSATAHHTWISIPFPGLLSEAIQGLAVASEQPIYFGDLLVRAGPAAWQGLIRQTHDLLMALGDTAYPAFPGRWANSLSRVYLQACQSDLMASVCTLDLTLTPSAALYYFHPAEQDLRDTVSTVYLRIGLGATTEVGPADPGRGIPTDEQLKSGFLQMEERAVELYQAISRKRSDNAACAIACNELTLLTAAMCVFSFGGRGSRVEEITNGDLLCDADVLCLEDKKVEHEGASRILPKPSQLKHWLQRLFVARQHLAERIAPTLRRDLAGRWKELASGQLRFDAPAFELLELQPGKVKRTPVTASDIEGVAQCYFQTGKNFMRHVLITHWALDGDDRHLLRLITGHARSGLTMPAAGAMYTPKSAVLAAGEILAKQLSKWLPDLKKEGVWRSWMYQFVALPGRRILKVHGAYRNHMQTWDAPLWSRWHLAATRIMNRIRMALLCGQGPADLRAKLWLHLVCFDGLNEIEDLQVVFSGLRPAAELSTTGWVLRFRRPSSSHMLVIPVQAPTALLLQRMLGVQVEDVTPFAEIADQAGQWVAATTPDCWGGAKDGIADALLACSRLWADWVLPPAVQLCYCPDSHAPLLDDQSNAALYGLPLHGTFEPITPPSLGSHPKDLLSAFFKVINRLGSSRLKFGEQKKRAQFFERWVKLGRIPQTGSFAGALIQVVGVNVGRITAGKKGSIEWSSQATYFSNLRPFLQEYANQSADDFDALDWLEFCQDLNEFANQADKQTVPVREAAAWLMQCLREVGYELPPQEALLDHTRHPVATTTTAIADINQSQIDAAKSLLSKTPRTPLDKARLDLSVTLLSSLPMRQGELAALHTNDLTLDGRLCITTHGFAHLKSHASRRRLQLQPDAWKTMQNVLDQTRNAQALGLADATIFGSNDQKDGLTELSSGWLTQALTWAIQMETGNSRFRIHALRAHVVSKLLCPEWQQITPAPHGERAGAQHAKELFTYAFARAWKTDVVRLIAGHASIRTTLSCYFHAWIPIRAQALMATLADMKPTDHLLAQVGVTHAALVKACARNAVFESDPWIYLLNKLPTALPSVSEANYIDTQISSTGNLISCHQTASVRDPGLIHQGVEQVNSPAAWVEYLGLRLLGIDRITASNVLNLLSTKDVDDLEFRLARSPSEHGVLRGRIKGDINGRALRADQKYLLAPTTTPLIGSLAKLPLDHLKTLFQLLLPKQSQLTWDVDLALVAPWLHETNVCIEVVSDIKCVDPALNLRLSRLKSVVIGPPAHDVGALPRVFIQPRESTARNTVAKARWTTLVRVLCFALLILHSTQSDT